MIEHLVPATLMIQEALAVAADLDLDGMLELLDKHGAAAIVSTGDDRRLTSARVRATMPEGWDGDLWARPRAAGLDPTLFAPVAPARRSGTTDRVAGRATCAPGELRPSGRNIHSEYSWDAYVTEAGQPPAKIALANTLTEHVEEQTGWTAKRTAGQIVFRDAGRRVLAIQLWLVEGVRIEADVLLGAPPADLSGSVSGRRTKKGSWYWSVSTTEQADAGIDTLIALVRSGSPSPTRTATSVGDQTLG